MDSILTEVIRRIRYTHTGHFVVMIGLLSVIRHLAPKLRAHRLPKTILGIIAVVLSVTAATATALVAGTPIGRPLFEQAANLAIQAWVGWYLFGRVDVAGFQVTDAESGPVRLSSMRDHRDSGTVAGG